MVYMSRWDKIKKRFHDMLEKQVMQDRPHRIALGCAFGVGVNFVPTFGIGFIFSFLLAVIFRGNRAGAAVTSLILGPLIPVMYALNLLVGGLILTPVAGKENLVEFVLGQYAGILRLGNIEDKIFGFLEFFGATFMVGAVINAAIFSIAFYFLVRSILRGKFGCRGKC